MSDLNPSALRSRVEGVQQAWILLDALLQAPPACLVPPTTPGYHSHWVHQTQKAATHTSRTGFLEMRPVFHWAGSFLTSNPGRGSSPRHLLTTSDFEKLNVLPNSSCCDQFGGLSPGNIWWLFVEAGVCHQQTKQALFHMTGVWPLLNTQRHASCSREAGVYPFYRYVY